MVQNPESTGPRNPNPKTWRAEKLSQRYVASYKPFNFVDGEGVRCSLYVSGCPFDCPGCYNKAAQNFRYGHPYTRELEDQIIKDIGQPYVQGLTLLGGEPFLNTEVCLSLVDRLRSEFGQTKDVWSWTGYTWGELQQDSEDKRELLSKIDILVDGRFELTQKDLTLQFRGSANQRIIDVQKSLKNGHVVIWDRLVK
ncbi:anaerobic ribonucleoside-triphosphate reductase activating protein [Sporolactobacillus sp. STCC-11]|uniref:anaerobic ribonucleoside-triphosphate reductase activating protein n=1 Tax=Sporolactobacillus caesalpiniae TaxID=3230362 RepID=UPI003394B050